MCRWTIGRLCISIQTGLPDGSRPCENSIAAWINYPALSGNSPQKLNSDQGNQSCGQKPVYEAFASCLAVSNFTVGQGIQHVVRSGPPVNLSCRHLRIVHRWAQLELNRAVQVALHGPYSLKKTFASLHHGDETTATRAKISG